MRRNRSDRTSCSDNFESGPYGISVFHAVRAHLGQSLPSTTCRLVYSAAGNKEEIKGLVRFAAGLSDNAGLHSAPGPPPVSLPQRKSSWQRLRSAERSVDFALNLCGSLCLPVERASVSTFLGHHVRSDVLKSLARGPARATGLSLVRFISLLHRYHALCHQPDNRLATPAPPATTNRTLSPMKAPRCCFTTTVV
jgi:hypothetical protein